MRSAALWVVRTLLGLLLLNSVPAQSAGPLPPAAEIVYKEMLTVYYGNLARRANGVPPLRWNGPMTEAARWFDWDSVENRPGGYCGHQDTLGRWPSERVPLFGYKGGCGAENCYCGYMEPQAAIDGWMNSPGHRANLLDPGSREIGMGYYVRASDGRGYLTQDFGTDAVYPPVIIDNEAPNTTDTAVDLYVYNRAQGGGFRELGPATEMQIANNPCFTDADWQPYQSELGWTLAAGSGWRTVYVRTRDIMGRMTTVNDTIYLGSTVPVQELGLHLASTNTPTVTLYGLDTTWSYVRLSQNWFADDTFGTFGLNWGNGERVNDATAWGGTAFRLYPGNGESNAWVWTTEFFKDTPLTAYVRLKVNNNTSTSEVARFSINGGGTIYGPLTLKGTDFSAPNVYQEFPLDFTYQNTSDVFLIFNFWGSGTADVYVDGVTIYTRRMPVSSSLTWQTPDGNYRGGSVWLRYEDDSGHFSPRQDAILAASRLALTPTALSFLVETGQSAAPQILTVAQDSCGDFNWSVNDNAAWLYTQVVGATIRVWVDATTITPGTYTATVTVTADSGVLDSPQSIPVMLRVAAQVSRIYLPLTLRIAP